MENTTEIKNLPLGDAENLILWAVVDMLLMVIIIGENILTICALRISRKLANLISNHFVCSLAFSDLMVGLMLPYHLAFYIKSSGLGDCKYTCLLRFIMIVLACCASIYNLLAIALDRYIAIVHPLHYNRFMTKRMVFTIISIGWFCAISLAATLMFWNDWMPGKECDLYNILPKNYVTIMLTPSFLLIWVAILILYWRIWKEAREHTKRMKSVLHSNGPANNDWKSVQVVLLILGCFSICWLPYFVVILTIKIHGLDNHYYEPAFILAMANSAINPAIYAWKNKGFRRAFLRLLKCKNPNLGENHFSYNCTRKASKPVEMPDKEAVNGCCNGTEQSVLQSEIVSTIKVKNKPEQSNAANSDNDKSVVSIICVKDINEKNINMTNGHCKEIKELICKNEINTPN